MKATSSSTQAVLLVGHGGVAQGTPREWVTELKRLEGERRRSDVSEPSPRERELESMIRNFPRDDASDPYGAGLRAIGARLASSLGARHVALAFNEFCAPSVEQALEDLVHGGMTHITVLTTMVTPGGSHSERELPELVAEARQRHPNVTIRYVWPYDLDELGRFFARQVALDDEGAG